MLTSASLSQGYTKVSFICIWLALGHIEKNVWAQKIFTLCCRDKQLGKPVGYHMVF